MYRVSGPVAVPCVPPSVLPARWGTTPAANPAVGNHCLAGCPLEGQGWVLVHGMMGCGRAAKREVAAGSDSHAS